MFALTLAAAGREVTLLEKTTEPHHKVCGEFLSRESLHYLDQHGLHPRALGAVPIHNVRLVTPWFQRECALPFPAWSLTRKRLDEELLSAATGRGVHVRRGAVVTALQQQGDIWSAAVRNGESIQAAHAVLATGKLDLGGWPRPQGRAPHLLAFKMYYRLTDQQLASVGQTVELLLYPGGYAGLQPVEGGVVNLCLLIDSRLLRTVGSQWDSVIQHLLTHSPHLRSRLQGSTALLPKPIAASHIPYGHLQSSALAGLWRVGDQAAVIPSFCGDGTAIALHSGALAATGFLHGSTSAAYTATLHRQLSTSMWLATRLARLLVDVPQASQLVRAFPGLIRAIASGTRIPQNALQQVS